MFFQFSSLFVVVCGLILFEPVRLNAAPNDGSGGGGGRKRSPAAIRNNNNEILDPDLVAPTEDFPNPPMILIEPDVYLLYWSVNATHILVEVHVKTHGWFSLGFKMPSDDDKNDNLVDFIMGFINDDGTAHLSDRHGLVSIRSAVDSRQDWTPLYMAKTNGSTIFKMARPLRLCPRLANTDNNNKNNQEDLDIPLNGIVTLVYSIGEVLNGEIVNYEVQQGEKDVVLMDFDLDESTLAVILC